MQKNAARYAKAAAATSEPDTIHVEVTLYPYLNMWGGDEPLDPEKTWQCSDIRIVRTCGHCEEQSTVDNMGDVWASDDSDGKQFLLDTITDMLAEHDGMPGIDDVEIIYGI